MKINCEMCGKEAKVKAIVEGAELSVCLECAKFGKTLRQAYTTPKIIKKERIKEPEKEEKITEDYAEKIRKKREQLGLKQEDFAKMLNEKESVIHKLEKGEFKPSLDLAKKIERKLGLKLIEIYEENKTSIKKTGKEEFTIGDFINIRKR